MSDPSPTILNYDASPRGGVRRPIVGGFVAGWLLGVIVCAAAVTLLLDGGGIVLVAMCVVGVLTGTPAYLLLCWFARRISVGNGVAFVIALMSSPIVMLGTLVLIVLSYRGS